MYGLHTYGNLLLGDGYGFWDRQNASDANLAVAESQKLVITAVDTGAAAEIAASVFRTTVTDTGSDIEVSQPNRYLAESVTVTEAISQRVILPIQNDSAIGNDLGSGNPAGHDFNVTVETASVRVRITAVENFYYTDLPNVGQKSNDVGAGVGDDQTLNALFVSIDSGSGTEVIGTRTAQIETSDANGIVSDNTVVASKITADEIAHGIDASLVHVRLPMNSDSGSSIQASVIKTKITAGDVGFAGLVEGRNISTIRADSGAGADNQSVKVRNTVGDVSWDIDVDEFIVVKLPTITDTGHGTDLRLNDAEIIRTETAVGSTGNVIKVDHDVADEFHAVDALPKMKRIVSEIPYVLEDTLSRVRVSTADSATSTQSAAPRVFWTRSDVGVGTQAQSMTSHISKAETFKAVEKQILARPIDVASSVKLVTGLTSAGHSLERVTP